MESTCGGRFLLERIGASVDVTETRKTLADLAR